MLHVDDKKMYVATYKEIILGFIVFSIILVILYPKHNLSQQVLSEQSNYDLSILYLQNMLENDRSNESLTLKLAEQTYKAGKIDLSFRLLNLLKNTKNRDIKSKSYRLSYKIAKVDYYYFKKHNKIKEKNSKFQELQDLYKTILDRHYYTKNDVQMLFQESFFLNDKKHGFVLLQELLKENTNDIKLVEDAYYILSDMKKYDESMKYLDRLSTLDTSHKNKWLEQKYFIVANTYEYNQAESYIIIHAQHSKFWENKLFRFYLDHKKYKKASKLYMNKFHKASSFSKKRELWINAINTLRAGNHNRDALRLAHKYENYFLRDKQARIALLKIYTALNDLNRAHRLSKKMLKMRK